MNVALRSYVDNLKIVTSWKNLIVLLTISYITVFVSLFLINNIERLFFNEYIGLSIYWTLISTGIFIYIGNMLTNNSLTNKSFNRNFKFALNISFLLILTVLLCAFLFRDLENSRHNPTISYFLHLLVMSVYEEVLYRYFFLTIVIYLFKKSNVKNAVWKGVLLVSFFFLIAHIPYTLIIGKVNWFNYLSIFLHSILFSWIYIKFSNIYMVIVFHLLLNISILFLPIYPSINVLLQLFLMISMFIVALYSKIFIKKYATLRHHP